MLYLENCSCNALVFGENDFLFISAKLFRARIIDEMYDENCIMNKYAKNSL